MECHVNAGAVVHVDIPIFLKTKIQKKKTKKNIPVFSLLIAENKYSPSTVALCKRHGVVRYRHVMTELAADHASSIL